jgi:methylthioribose-1-phosphate isomerase
MTEQKGTTVWAPLRPVQWKDDACVLLDQRLLPAEEIYLSLGESGAVANAIRDMVVRGAPAIGIAAAFGAALAYREAAGDEVALRGRLGRILAARPTASNLAWAVRRIAATAEGSEAPFRSALSEAKSILEEDVAMNHAMGCAGAELIEGPCDVVTHCNAGALATGGFGTALGVIRQGWSEGRIRHVYSGETRPWQQGSRLTCWELARDGIPVTLLVDSAMGQLFRRERPSWLIVGADRIVANGDTANKIGTYSLAVLARQHGAKVMVVAPSSTFDLATPDGEGITVEHRPDDEIWSISGAKSGVSGVEVDNPVFDVTPAASIDVIVTDKGVIQAPDSEKISRVLKFA